MDLFMVNLVSSQAEAVTRGANVWDLIAALQNEPDRFLNLEQSWCGLHFVLTGEVPILKYEALQRGTAWYEDSLENVLMGGEPTVWECAFGLVRYVAPSAVAYIEPKLAETEVSTLASWYDPTLLTEYNIPPDVWFQNTSARSWLLDNFVKLKLFYHETVQQSYGLLIYIV